MKITKAQRQAIDQALLTLPSPIPAGGLGHVARLHSVSTAYVSKRLYVLRSTGQTTTRALRSAHPWTAAEDSQLEKALCQLAREFSRSPGAICTRGLLLELTEDCTPGNGVL